MRPIILVLHTALFYAFECQAAASIQAFSADIKELSAVPANKLISLNKRTRIPANYFKSRREGDPRRKKKTTRKHNATPLGEGPDERGRSPAGDNMDTPRAHSSLSGRSVTMAEVSDAGSAPPSKNAHEHKAHQGGFGQSLTHPRNPPEVTQHSRAPNEDSVPRQGHVKDLIRKFEGADHSAQGPKKRAKLQDRIDYFENLAIGNASSVL